MTCNTCRGGWTALGQRCPNGCPVDLKVNIVELPLPKRKQAYRDDYLANLRKNLESYRAMTKRFSPPPGEPGDFNVPPNLWAELVTARRGLTPIQRAHFEWCDSVLAALTDEGMLDPPHVLLSLALNQLVRIIVKLNKIESGEMTAAEAAQMQGEGFDP